MVDRLGLPSEAENWILQSLIKSEGLSGIDIVKMLDPRTPIGSVYTLLDRMRKAGLVMSKFYDNKRGGGMVMRYWITHRGRVASFCREYVVKQMSGFDQDRS